MLLIYAASIHTESTVYPATLPESRLMCWLRICPVIRVRNTYSCDIRCEEHIWLRCRPTSNQWGVKIVSIYGLAVVGVNHCNYYGMASTYILRAVQQGFTAFAFTNASRSMPRWRREGAFIWYKSILQWVFPGVKHGILFLI